MLTSFFALECKSHHEPYAVFCGCRQIVVVKSVNILYVDNLKDVVYSGYKLYIWAFAVHDV